MAIDRSLDEEVALTIPLRALPTHRVVEHLVLADPQLDALNTRDDPCRVVPRSGPGPQYDEGTVAVLLPGVSWNVIRLRAE